MALALLGAAAIFGGAVHADAKTDVQADPVESFGYDKMAGADSYSLKVRSHGLGKDATTAAATKLATEFCEKKNEDIIPTSWYQHMTDKDAWEVTVSYYCYSRR